jgi:peroxiredoxin
MQKLFYPLFTAFVLMTACSQKKNDSQTDGRVNAQKETTPNLTIKMQFAETDTGSVILSYESETNPMLIDTVKLVNGKGEKKIFVAGLQMLNFIRRGNSANLMICSGPGNLQISGKVSDISFEDIKVTGDALPEGHDNYMKEMAAWHAKWDLPMYKLFKPLEMLGGNDSLMNELKKKPQSYKDSLQMIFEGSDSDRRAITKRFMQTHPGTSMALCLLYENSMYEEIQAAELKQQLQRFPEAVQNEYYGIKIKKLIEKSNSTEVGRIAPDFQVPDTEGKMVTLKDYRSKYVLVDFWASWCAPCRAENPHLLKAHRRFKEKNFDILGVSLDNDAAKWRAAITKDALPWKQVCDLKADASEVAKAYGVRGIPVNFLIDPEGRIVARDLRGEALETELQKHLK